jgi:hypothetical protein
MLFQIKINDIFFQTIKAFNFYSTLYAEISNTFLLGTNIFSLLINIYLIDAFIFLPNYTTYFKLQFLILKFSFYKLFLQLKTYMQPINY